MISQLTYNRLHASRMVGENQRFCYFNDELDESNFGNNTRTTSWTSQTSMPRNYGVFRGSVESVDHNMPVIEQRCTNRIPHRIARAGYQRCGGGSLELVGYFDTNPNPMRFHASPEQLPVLSSGNIGVSTFTRFLCCAQTCNCAESVSVDEPAGEGGGLSQPGAIYYSARGFHR